VKEWRANAILVFEEQWLSEDPLSTVGVSGLGQELVAVSADG
jgi:hypothetical protein